MCTFLPAGGCRIRAILVCAIPTDEIRTSSILATTDTINLLAEFSWEDLFSDAWHEADDEMWQMGSEVGSMVEGRARL